MEESIITEQSRLRSIASLLAVIIDGAGRLVLTMLRR